LAHFASVNSGTVFTEALEVSREFLRLAPGSGATRGHHEANVAGLLAMAYFRDRDAETLNEAITAARSALLHTPDGHADMAARQEVLGWTLRLLHQSSQDRAALLESIGCARQALAATHENAPQFGMRLSNLADCLLGLYTDTEDDTVLTLAVELSRRAARAVPVTNAHRSHVLLRLGYALERLGGDASASRYLDEAADVYAECADDTAGNVLHRAEAAYNGAIVHMRRQRPQEAAQTVERLVRLLPQASGRHLDRPEREHLLKGMPGLATTVGGIMVAAGRPERAAELLEQTRGMLFSEVVDDRHGLTTLRSVAPELADRCEALLQEFAALDGALSRLQGPPDWSTAG
jgi:tetratricopeptide (TPR) repeat protein